MKEGDTNGYISIAGETDRKATMQTMKTMEKERKLFMSKKMKLLSSILSMSLVCGLFVTTIPVSASEKPNMEDANEVNVVIDCADDGLSPELKAVYEKLISADEMKEGDVKILDQIDGEKFFVEVTDVESPGAGMVPYSGNISTSSREFVFYKHNILGIRKDIFKVTSTCTWVKGSRIINLHCEYEKLASGVTCSWNDRYKQATDVFQTLALDVTYSSKSLFVIFDAVLGIDKNTVKLGCSEEMDL